MFFHENSKIEYFQICNSRESNNLNICIFRIFGNKHVIVLFQLNSLSSCLYTNALKERMKRQKNLTNLDVGFGYKQSSKDTDLFMKSEWKFHVTYFINKRNAFIVLQNTTKHCLTDIADLVI